MSKKINKTIIPVVVFGFNRGRQLKQTLAALKNEKIPLLYVFCDGARNQYDDKAVADVVKIVDSIKWTKVKITRNKKNLGLSESIQAGLNQVFMEHETAIIVEDDIVVAEGFYDYMCRVLTTYSDRDDIAGVTALHYPTKKRVLNRIQEDVFLAPRFSSWGWGTWRRVWRLVDFTKFSLPHKVAVHKPDLARGGKDVEYAYYEYAAGRLDGCWDVLFGVNMALKNQYFVWPKKNLITNVGLSEGSHADGSEDWGLVADAVGTEIVSIPKDIKPDPVVIREFVNYFKHIRLPLKPRVKRKLRKIQSDFTSRVPVINKPDPKLYTTTDGPQEVLSQKECYYFALNNFVRDGDSVLDVGMGIGYGMGVLSIKAKEVRAIDVDKKAVSYNKQRLIGKNPRIVELLHYDGIDIPFDDNTFDVVTCIDVIEHVANYDHFLDELIRVSKRAVIIATPNKRAEYTNPDGTPTNYWHLVEWTFEEFDEIAKKHSKASVDWNFLNGSWEGPHTFSKKLQPNTLALVPVFMKEKK